METKENHNLQDLPSGETMDLPSSSSKSKGLHDHVVATPMTFLGIPFIAALALHFIFPARILAFPLAQIGGLGIIAFSIILSAWSVAEMTKVGASPDAFNPPAELVTRGPFRFSRNPIYLSFVLIFAGVGLMINSLWMLLLLPVVVFGLTWGIIIRDERFLEGIFGEKYLAYKARVRRWL